MKIHYLLFIKLLLLNFYSYGQGNDSIQSEIEQISNQLKEIDIQIIKFESLKDSLTKVKQKLVNETATKNIGIKKYFAQISSNSTPLKESVEGFNLLMKLEKGTEIEILGAKNNYLFVKKDDVYGYLSSMFVKREDPEINELINGLLEDEREKKEAEKRNTIEENEKRFQENRKLRIQSKFKSEIAKRLINREIWIGMTREMVAEGIGYPSKINRTVLAKGIREQWVFENIYLYFDNGVLTAWQD